MIANNESGIKGSVPEGKKKGGKSMREREKKKESNLN